MKNWINLLFQQPPRQRGGEALLTAICSMAELDELIPYTFFHGRMGTYCKGQIVERN